MSTKSVLVTGGTGFFGSHICMALDVAGYQAIPISSKHYDLLDQELARMCLEAYKPDYVVHCAAKSGGILWNKENPESIYVDNVRMSTNLLTAAAHAPSVQKVVSIISSCAYPAFSDTLHEYMFWQGLPHSSIRFFGLQKRNIAALSMALSQQTGKTFVWPTVNNLYGTRDTFHPKRTKVVGATIRKIVEAHQGGHPSVTCFGTGEPTRQFTYVEDAAHAIAVLLENYDQSQTTINVTSPEEISIGELYRETARIVGYTGQIEYDTTQPDGQRRKSMSGYQFRGYYQPKGFTWTPFENGLKHTINWYIENQQLANEKE